MKRALVIGIDDYVDYPLKGCVNDAFAVTAALEVNGDGSPNFGVKRLTSSDLIVTTEVLNEAIEDLFLGDAETVVLFFAGHGLINAQTNSGFIVSQDGKKGAWGMALGEILTLANKAYPKIKSTVLILDSCHAGFAGELGALNNENLSTIGTGVTILTAAHRDGAANEEDGHGMFTSMLVDGLNGSAADICGRITPASVYSHIDQTLGDWEQRPIYKANVQNFITLRAVEPKVPLEVLRRLPTYFPEPNSEFALDPTFEPDRQNVPERFRHLPVNDVNCKVFRELQRCNRHGLVVPVGADHMYDAAMASTSCRLTALGAHYRRLAHLKRI